MTTKRALDPCGAPAGNSKRSRPSPDQDECKQQPPEATTASALYERLQHVPFPETITALPHVLRLIDTLAMTPQEALMEATTTHQSQWVEQLLQRFKCPLGDAMVRAATKGFVDIAQLLEDHIECDGDEDEGWEIDDTTKKFVKEAVVAAAKNGHCEVVQLLMPLVMLDRSRFSMSYYPSARSVFDAAAGNGQLGVVKFMTEHAHRHHYAQRYSIWAPVDTLEHAIAGGHLEVANFLIGDSRIFWNLKKAFAVAVEKELFTVAEKIADVFPERYHEYKLFSELAHSGELGAVKYLYNSRCNAVGPIQKAFAKAASGGHADVVKFLLDTGHISSDGFDKAFKRACYGYENMDVVKLLYNLKRATLKGINRAFATANDIAVLKFLDHNENISDESVIAAFNQLNCNFVGRVEILKLLVSKPCIPSELIDKAFVEAAKSGRTFSVKGQDDTVQIINLLRGDSRLSSAAIGEAFVSAIKSGNKNLHEPLCEQQQIPPEALVRAFVEAAHRKRIDTVKKIVDLLSAEKLVPHEVRCQAFIAAARHGQMEILEIVCKSEAEEWPLKVLKEAIDVAGGNIKIVNLLRKMVCDQVFKGIS